EGASRAVSAVARRAALGEDLPAAIDLRLPGEGGERDNADDDAGGEQSHHDRSLRGRGEETILERVVHRTPRPFLVPRKARASRRIQWGRGDAEHPRRLLDDRHVRRQVEVLAKVEIAGEGVAAGALNRRARDG